MGKLKIHALASVATVDKNLGETYIAGLPARAGSPLIVLAHVNQGVVMAVPRSRNSNSRSGKRRAHDHVKKRQLGFCPQCSTAVPTHVICPKCGYYQGRTVVQQAEK